MRARYIALLAVSMLLASALPAHGQGGIIVNGASTVRQENSNIDPGLGAATSSVRPRVVFGNANTQRHEPVIVPPESLQNLFTAVRSRVVFDAANTSRSATLSYPIALIGDTTPAQISAISDVRQGSTASISWTTNEFATSTVLYGTVSGNLTQNASDPLFVREHQVTLTGLTSGATYYYRVRSVDLSGNVAQSQERVLRSQTFLFVPLIRRSN